MEFFFVIASSNDWFAFVPKNISCLSNSFKRTLHRWIGFFFNRSVSLGNFPLNCILFIGINLHWQIFSWPKCLSLLEPSPIDYHQICGEKRDLLCFVDDVYLCLCVENPIRVECFISDDNLDHCSRCLFGGLCLQGNRHRRSRDFMCVCRSCHWADECQLHSRSFPFTLDQLFSLDLLSDERWRTIIPLLFSLRFVLVLVKVLVILFGECESHQSFVNHSSLRSSCSP